MTAVRVTLTGCDDVTYIDLDATDDERAFLVRLAALSKEASEYGCMPTMSVRERGQDDD